MAVIANLEVSRSHDGVAFERFTPEGPMALLPLPGQRMELVWTHQGGAEATLAASDGDFLARLQQAFGDRAGHFRRVGKRHAYPLSLVTAHRAGAPGSCGARQRRPCAASGGRPGLQPGAARGDGPGGGPRGGVDGGRAPGDMAPCRPSRRSGPPIASVIRFSDGLIRLFGSIIRCSPMPGRQGLSASTWRAAAPGLGRRAMGRER